MITPKQALYLSGALLALFVCWFCYHTGYKSAENKYLEEQAKAVEEAIANANSDAADLREVEIKTVEKIKYVDKIVWKKEQVLVESECPAYADELARVFVNPVVEEINNQL